MYELTNSCSDKIKLVLLQFCFWRENSKLLDEYLAFLKFNVLFICCWVLRWIIVNIIFTICGFFVHKILFEVSFLFKYCQIVSPNATLSYRIWNAWWKLSTHLSCWGTPFLLPAALWSPCFIKFTTCYTCSKPVALSPTFTLGWNWRGQQWIYKYAFLSFLFFFYFSSS